MGQAGAVIALPSWLRVMHRLFDLRHRSVRYWDKVDARRRIGTM
jgi:hypothetical protein